MSDIAMPRLSDSMEEGTILKWLIGDGDPVTEGQELVEIETDKATMTHTADVAGTSRYWRQRVPACRSALRSHAYWPDLLRALWPQRHRRRAHSSFSWSARAHADTYRERRCRRRHGGGS
jgi:Biotin-requiring enzyme